MPQREKTGPSVVPGARVGALRSAPPPAVSKEELGTTRAGLAKPKKTALQCIQHDARSAYHSLAGFVELLGWETLGAISHEQKLSMAHVQASALSLLELIESSVELSLPVEPLGESERRAVSLVGLLRRVVHSAMREHAGWDLTLQVCPDSQDLTMMLEPEEVARTLGRLLEVLGGASREPLQVLLSSTDLHVVLSVSTAQQEESVTQSMPVPSPTSDVDAASSDLCNKDFIRLKRCEASMSRQGGRLVIASDLSRARVTFSRRI